jgi:hypothetical protein
MKTSINWRDNEFPPNCRSTDDVYKFLRRVGKDGTKLLVGECAR